MNVEGTGVDDLVGQLPEGPQTPSLLGQGGGNGLVALERMWTAGLAVATDQGAGSGLQIDKGDGQGRLLQSLEQLGEPGQFGALAHVNDDGGAFDLSPGLVAELRELGNQLQREIVDAEIPHVFKGLQDRVFAGPAQTSDDDKGISGFHLASDPLRNADYGSISPKLPSLRL